MLHFLQIYFLTCIYGCFATIQIGIQHQSKLSEGMQGIQIQNFAPLNTAHHSWAMKYITNVLVTGVIGNEFPAGVICVCNFFVKVDSPSSFCKLFGYKIANNPNINLAKDTGYYEECELKLAEVNSALDFLVAKIPELVAQGVAELNSGLKLTGGTLFYIGAKGYASKLRLCSIGNYVQALLVLEGTFGN